MDKAIGYKDLGWANGWGIKTPPEYDAHVKANEADPDHGKQSSDTDLSSGYGLDHLCICRTCRIIWHYDSGD
jgi:hypothetical protein